MVSFTKLAIATVGLAASVAAVPTGLGSVRLFAVYMLGCLNADGTYTVNSIFEDCPKLFQFAASGTGVTVTSARGPCGVAASGAVTCGTGVTPAVFGIDSNGLTLDGGFSSDSTWQVTTQTLYNNNDRLFGVTLEPEQ